MGYSNISNRGLLALFIVLNILLILSFFLNYHSFLNEPYVGTFWNWSWDFDYWLRVEETKQDLAIGLFWIPFLTSWIPSISILRGTYDS